MSDRQLIWLAILGAISVAAVFMGKPQTDIAVFMTGMIVIASRKDRP